MLRTDNAEEATQQTNYYTALERCILYLVVSCRVVSCLVLVGAGDWPDMLELLLRYGAHPLARTKAVRPRNHRTDMTVRF
jgi:hypothetical protein